MFQAVRPEWQRNSSAVGATVQPDDDAAILGFHRPAFACPSSPSSPSRCSRPASPAARSCHGRRSLRGARPATTALVRPFAVAAVSPGSRRGHDVIVVKCSWPPDFSDVVDVGSGGSLENVTGVVFVGRFNDVDGLSRHRLSIDRWWCRRFYMTLVSSADATDTIIPILLTVNRKVKRKEKSDKMLTINCL